MLYKETVDEATLELLKELKNDSYFKSFFLVGGTALSLQIGHRISIDLDLFSLEPFNAEETLEYLENNYQFKLNYKSKNSLKGEIKKIKVDLITHQYPLTDELIEFDSIVMASVKEISAMKLNAIMINGTRLKDFIDIAFLSAYLSFNDMLEAYESKYSTRNPVMVAKSLTYFDDINYDEPIILINEKYDWSKVENRLKKMISNPNIIFDKTI